MIAAVAIAAIVGGLFGLLADRLATRWPEHEPGYARRGFDWRTLLVVLGGAAIAAGLVLRWQEPRDLLVLGIYAGVLVMLLATDLDQKLLPDLLTLPLIAYTAVVLLVAWSPLLAATSAPILNGVAAGIGAALFLGVTDFLLRGELGGGDLKLAVAIGLMSGVGRLFSGFLLASIVSSLVLLALMAIGRLGRRTAIPFGPVLIGAAFVAALQP